MAEQLHGITLFPQELLNVRLSQTAQNWEQNIRFQHEIAEVKRELGSQGRVLVRPSGTEPVLRLMVEASESALAKKMTIRLANAIS